MQINFLVTFPPNFPAALYWRRRSITLPVFSACFPVGGGAVGGDAFGDGAVSGGAVGGDAVSGGAVGGGAVGGGAVGGGAVCDGAFGGGAVSDGVLLIVFDHCRWLHWPSYQPRDRSTSSSTF